MSIGIKTSAEILERFTIGADPEIFVTKKGVAISAHGLVPGSKYEPFAVPGGAFQVDGTALEFNIEPAPLSEFKTFDERVVSVQEAIVKEAKKSDPEIEVNISSVQEYSKEYLNSLPAEATALGCDPDYNAYTLKPNPLPDASREFRTGAGHLHFGWTTGVDINHPDHIEICAEFVKVLDATVGLFCCLIEDDPRRRELYGKAGAFRPKHYGVEYRTPSNVWLTTPARRSSIHALSCIAVNLRAKSWDVNRVERMYGMSIEDVINQGQKNLALQILREQVMGSYIIEEALREVGIEYYEDDTVDPDFEGEDEMFIPEEEG